MNSSNEDTRSIGECLKAEREKKGLSIEDAARETNIARKYISALEEEDFSQFPAETYLLGFLGNYGEYLGLSVKNLVSQYRILKIQEQPIPVEQLLRKAPPNVPRIVFTTFVVLVCFLLVCGSAYYFFFMPKNKQIESNAGRMPVEYSFAGGTLEQRFYEGDTLIILLAGNSYKVSLHSVADVIMITAPDKDIRLGLNNEVLADINSDGIAELKINAIDYAQNRPEIGAQLRFEMLTQTLAIEQTASAVDIPALNAAESAPVVIFNEARPYPFTLQAVFSSYCMFRWEILREAVQQKRTERYYVKGEEQTIQAQNGVRIWISNSSAVKLWAIGGGHNVSLETGGAGEVVVEDIYWTHDEDGRYKLVRVRLEN
ncbi:MAG: helix-turn-helix domain-containing protein [Spirochaetaceae bacterium]|jgi:cytoskeletal protein RodZ|nr:helix-turn-helix domain-containing protein [Spirochaetaceae bacterium]